MMVIGRILDLFRRPPKPEHVIEDEFLGRLAWSEMYGGWDGVMTLESGGTGRFTIEGVEAEETIAEAARNTINFLKANEPLIRARIAAAMSEFYNGSWGNGDIITPEEMARRIALDVAHIYENGEGMLYYEAYDNLFTDHTIRAPIGANGEIGEPELEG